MKVVLSIAGSDSSGGAGIQADLKTFEAFNVFGTTAITALTAQNTTGVEQIVGMDAAFVKKQIEMVLNDFDVAAIKIGMLFNKEIIDAVCEMIQDLHIPIVLDPVSISKAGSPLLEDDALSAMKSLFDHVTLITPNHHEAYEFFGYIDGDTKSLEMIQSLNTPVLIKHHVVESTEGSFSVDQLYFQRQKRLFQSPLIETSNLHGTGCSFSSAITANLALGHSLEKSISIAKSFIAHGLREAPDIGNGPGPIHHKKGGEYAAIA
ncbi:bifunctional hydroxymethylpyrimidine kinase/phosphomethylpyrimidine kinase [Sulfurovum sp. XTW-4]|uniref:hydroxymethylpyrimidine kinase n=1 Tax=Sulfurovum xiamenensis TaxID=3019066 RepID=A0ABT7QR89_9BACT|nr:bifunctional hydroxymethylpyrimidine kinase/phosphomethylpyrimidine kinase [Sulfurovum xiamenensis]MDM5263603.1 bifunctional hydroxymethylpyrimidine kinase/phosphomethylpyrimidine kinase [Sulfurovum xiamenensis]